MKFQFLGRTAQTRDTPLWKALPLLCFLWNMSAPHNDDASMHNDWQRPMTYLPTYNTSPIAYLSHMNNSSSSSSLGGRPSIQDWSFAVIYCANWCQQAWTHRTRRLHIVKWMFWHTSRHGLTSTLLHVDTLMPKGRVWVCRTGERLSTIVYRFAE